LSSADRTRRQDAQSQQARKVLRIGFVAAVLQSFVPLDRRRVGKMHVEADVLQSIDQPIPVVGRLDHHAGQFVLSPSQEVCDLHDVVGQALLRHNPIAVVDSRDNAIVGMQINPAVHHPRLLVVKSDSMITNSL
jgi:hypothetical protein